MDIPTALDVIYQAIDSLNELRAADDQIEKSISVMLAGEGGVLDSLGLITLTLAVERRIAQMTGKQIILLHESDYDANMSHLATPQTIAELIVERASA